MSALNDVQLKNPSTPQTEKAAKGQRRNNAGGFSFKVDDVTRFDRFLTIGTEGGTYYVGQQRLTDKTVKFVRKYISKNGVAAVKRIVEVSDQGLAPKNDQALFALAIALDDNNPVTKAAAKAAVPKVVRTATHLYQFMQFIDNNMGWGRAKTSAVAGLLESWTPDKLAYQAAKYRSRSV